MVTKVKKATAFNPVQTFLEHLTYKTEAARIASRSDALKKRLKEWLPAAPDAYENENGSRFYDLPDTIEVGGTAYKGMELRRAVSTTFDEDVAESILKRKKVYDEATVTVTSIDQDKVYGLYQEGKITEGDLGKMFAEKESYAFWPVKGEVL